MASKHMLTAATSPLGSLGVGCMIQQRINLAWVALEC